MFHLWWMCDGYFPNSLGPISYLGLWHITLLAIVMSVYLWPIYRTVHLITQPKLLVFSNRQEYHRINLGYVCFRPENQSFLWKKQRHTQTHEQGTHSVKMGAVVWPKIHQMPQKIRPKPKWLGFLKKELSLGVRSPCIHSSNIENANPNLYCTWCMEEMTHVQLHCMAVRVFELSNGVYKIGKIFAKKST